MPFFVSLIILSRQKTPEKCPPAISLVAASFISGIFEEYLDWGDIAFVSPPSIFYLLVASLVQKSSHRFPAFSASTHRENRITSTALQELKKRYHTAVGAERIIESMNKVPTQTAVDPGVLAINAQQQEILTHFGPELCIEWDSVLSTGPAAVHQPQGTMHGQLVSSMQTDTQLLGQNDFESHLASSNGVSQPAQANLAYDSSAWNDSTLFGGAGEPHLDLYGQWWWSDFLPSGLSL